MKDKRGWLVLFLSLTLVRGLLYAFLVLPWQAPDENGHFEHIWLITRLGRLPAREDASPTFEREMMGSFYEWDFDQFALGYPFPARMPARLDDPSGKPMVSIFAEEDKVSAWHTHLVATGGVALVLLLGLMGVQKVAEGVRTEQPRATASVGELVASTSAGQTFIAEYPGLSLVEVRLATYARENTDPLIFHLRASPDAAENLFTTTIDAADVEDNAYYTFEFPRVRDSAGRTFYFCLEAPEAEPGNGITVWGATEDAYPDGEAVLEGLEDRGVRDLTFRLGYDPPLGVKAGILLERLVANKPSLWGDRWLYIVLALTYLVLLYALFVRIMGVGASGDGKG